MIRLDGLFKSNIHQRNTIQVLKANLCLFYLNPFFIQCRWKHAYSSFDIMRLPGNTTHDKSAMAAICGTVVFHRFCCLNRKEAAPTRLQRDCSLNSIP